MPDKLQIRINSKLLKNLEKQMMKAAKVLDFERAAELRDKIKKLRDI